jgi:NADH dehydrogenase
MQMARHTARLIEDELNHERVNPRVRPPFEYWNRGTMATIGRSAAVAQIGRLQFSGWPAWAAWLLVHLIFLIGFRNRAAVMLQWVYSYFTYKLGSRIITRLDDSRETTFNVKETSIVCQTEK